MTDLSLDEFISSLKASVDSFEKSYRKHHAENPEHYPLVLPADNSGLWFEFFIDHFYNEPEQGE